MEFKLSLVMNNAGDYALDLNHKGVHVKFPPANTTSLIQPLDQGITFAFKMLYTWKYLQRFVDAINSNKNFKLKKYKCLFKIAMCLSVIHAALTYMKDTWLSTV